MSLLEQNTRKKGQVNKLFKSELELDIGENKEYEVETTKNSAIYANEVVGNQLPELYYLVSWKGYSKDESILEPVSAVVQLWKMISTFYKNCPKKLTITSLRIDSVLPIVMPIAKPLIKILKQKQSTKTPFKGVSKNWCCLLQLGELILLVLTQPYVFVQIQIGSSISGVWFSTML